MYMRPKFTYLVRDTQPDLDEMERSFERGYKGFTGMAKRSVTL